MYEHTVVYSYGGAPSALPPSSPTTAVGTRGSAIVPGLRLEVVAGRGAAGEF